MSSSRDAGDGASTSGRSTHIGFGISFGICASAIVPAGGLAACIFGSAICMAVIMFWALLDYKEHGWTRINDLTQVLYIPLITAMVVWATSTLQNGPIAAAIHTAAIIATSMLTFSVFWAPLKFARATTPARQRVSDLFVRTMLTCNSENPEKC